MAGDKTGSQATLLRNEKKPTERGQVKIAQRATEGYPGLYLK